MRHSKVVVMFGTPVALGKKVAFRLDFLILTAAIPVSGGALTV
jgi:hypothetical protein